MTKRIPLDRLREISRKRTIKRPDVLQDRRNQLDHADKAETPALERPIRS